MLLTPINQTPEGGASLPSYDITTHANEIQQCGISLNDPSYV